MVAVYCKCPHLREQLRPPLSGVEVAWTETWDDFTAVRSGAEVGVYCTPDYTSEDSMRLRKVVVASVGGPGCVVVTPLSLERLQLLREMDRCWFQVVWAEEVGDRLLVGLQRAGWHKDPLRIFANRILAGAKPRPQVEKALRIACGLDQPPPLCQNPRTSSAHRARHLAPLLAGGPSHPLRSQGVPRVGGSSLGGAAAPDQVVGSDLLRRPVQAPHDRAAGSPQAGMHVGGRGSGPRARDERLRGMGGRAVRRGRDPARRQLSAGSGHRRLTPPGRPPARRPPCSPHGAPAPRVAAAPTARQAWRRGRPRPSSARWFGR